MTFIASKKFYLFVHLCKEASEKIGMKFRGVLNVLKIALLKRASSIFLIWTTTIARRWGGTKTFEGTIPMRFSKLGLRKWIMTVPSLCVLVCSCIRLPRSEMTSVKIYHPLLPPLPFHCDERKWEWNIGKAILKSSFGFFWLAYCSTVTNSILV